VGGGCAQRGGRWRPGSMARSPVKANAAAVVGSRTFRSLEALPASSSTSAVRYSEKNHKGGGGVVQTWPSSVRPHGKHHRDESSNNLMFMAAGARKLRRCAVKKAEPDRTGAIARTRTQDGGRVDSGSGTDASVGSHTALQEEVGSTSS
jgi:hypothetical protein